MNFTFSDATREQAKARIALQGPAGCGKTMTGLRLGVGLAQGGLIGVVDTERGSALKYAPVPGRPDLGGIPFKHMPMDSHDPRNLIAAVRAADQAGIAVLLVDSWSHFWNGKGGLLEIVERAGSKPGAGGSFGGWREGTPIEQQMLDALLTFPGHLIVTMRTKGDYVIEDDPRTGRKKVKKIGVKAVQREGSEYEFDVVMDMVEGVATVTKTRYAPLAELEIQHPGEEEAEVILDQLGAGVDPVQLLMDRLTAETLTYQGAIDLHADAVRRGLLDSPVLDPASGEPSTLGAAIAARGTALKPKPVAAVDPTPPPATTTASGTAGAGATAAATASPSPETPPQQPAPAADAGKKLTEAQKRKLGVVFGKFEIADKAARLHFTSTLLGRPVPSWNDLTTGEAAFLIDGFERSLASPDPRGSLNDAMNAARNRQGNAA